jgi:hypothetical protein
MQNMACEIRHTIVKDMVDLDMANAHPVILAFLCKQKNIPSKYLDKLNEKREKYLERIKLPREKAKKLVLSLLNGGTRAYKNLKKKPKWLVNFSEEVKKIHAAFATGETYRDFVREQPKDSWNLPGRFLNIILCDFENKILLKMFKFFKVKENSTCVMCFDGAMLPRASPAANYDLKGCQDYINSTLGIKIQLKIKPMDQGLKIPTEIEEYVPYKMPRKFDADDNYDYAEFQNEFREYEFDSYEELDQTISKKYPLVIAKIMEGKGMFVKKSTNGKISMVESLGITDFSMYFELKKKKIKQKFSAYLEKKNGFSEIECELGHVQNKKNFNVWPGFQAKISRDAARAGKAMGCERMKKFIFETWASSNPEYYTYIISWMADLVSTKNRNGVALVLISEPGCGKGFVIQFLRYILRNCTVAEVVGVNSITQKHNTIIQNKRLVIINEMSSTKDEFKSNWDRIKANITDDYLTIEPKGLKPYTIENIGNYILCSNHEDSLIVEGRDRRYSIFEVADKYKDNHEFFEDLASSCMNQESADAFYTYLLDWQESDEKVNVKKIIHTNIRSRAINLSKPTPLKFIECIKEEPIIADDGEPMTGYIKAKVLYTKYQEWCRANGERGVVSSTKFGCAISKILDKKKSNSVYYSLPQIVV